MRKQIVGAWAYSSDPDSSDSLRFRWPAHPRLLDVLDLAIRDHSGEVNGAALSALRPIALRDFFHDDFPVYESWFARNRERPMEEVVREALRVAVENLRASDAEGRQERVLFLHDNLEFVLFLPDARETANAAGLGDLLRAWTSDPDADTASAACAILTQIGLPRME